MIFALLPLLILAGVVPDDRHARAVTAFRVAAWARERSDAASMLAAARMLADAGVRDAESRPAALALAAEAEAMAPNDREVAKQADAVRDSAPRGILRGPLGDGPVAIRHTLLAGGSAAWPLEARGGTTAIVSAVGDGDADIDLRVTRAHATVCADLDKDANPMCRWRVTRNAVYRVAIANRGRVATRIVLLSN